MTSRSSTTTPVYDQSGHHHRRRWSVFVQSPFAETTSPVSMYKRSEPSTCRVNRADERRECYRLPTSEQLYLFVFADDDAGIFLDSRDVPPSSRSVSSTDDSLPGTSRCTPSDIVYRRLRACDCFRRYPLPFCRTGPPYNPHLVAGIRRPAFQRWSPRTDAVTRRREPLSDVGSDRCLHPR